MENLLRATQVAIILGISRSAVFELWKRGELPSVRIGRSIRCRPSDLEAFIEANVVNGNKNLPTVTAVSKSASVTVLAKGVHHEQ